MSESKKTKLVSSAKFSNTSHGATNKVGDFIVSKDAEGNTLYTRNLRVTSTQVDRTFPAVITAKKVAEIASTSLTKKQPLQVVAGVDYRLGGEPTTLPESDDGSLPAVVTAFFYPVVIRDAISF
tara:strand:+ start:1808 stop:2179 length:372 start_codon:yes stop_codon:yes gene_type:complete